VSGRVANRVSDRGLAAASLLLAATIWGTAAVVTKVALASFSPYVLSTMRWSIALGVMVALLRRQDAAPIRNRATALLGLFGMLGFTTFYSFGLQRTSAANTTLIGGGTPVLISVVLAALVRCKPKL
jgi:drug/metabolite transporter (DMT)-like permease